MARQLTNVEIWNDVEASTAGSRLAVLSDYRTARDLRELNGPETLRVGLRRENESWPDLQERRVLRTVFSDGSFDEWRITKIQEAREPDLTGLVECESPKYDLGSRLMERVEADGSASPYFELYGLTPTEHLGVILQDAPAYFSAGTVASSAEGDMVYDWDSPLSAVGELAQLNDLELDVRRTSTGYKVNLPEAVGSSMDKAYLRYARNLTGVRRTSEVQTNHATRVYPRGGGQPGERLTMGDARWLVDGVAGVVLTMSTQEGSPILVDDQLNGLYVEEPGGTIKQIVDSGSMAQTITLSAGHGVSAGERIWVRRNSSGAQLTYLEHPTNLAAYGLVSAPLDRQDIPRVDNLAENPFLSNYTAGAPDNWASFPSTAPVLAESTGGQLRRYGSASLKVTSTAQGHGVQSDILSVTPSSKAPHFSAQITLRVVHGAVKLEMVDTSSPQDGLYPPPEAEAARTSVTDTWVDNLLVSGIDLKETGSTGVRLRITAHTTAGAEWYLDAAQLTQTAGGAEWFYDGRASNDLWLAANAYLLTNSAPRLSFDVDVLDLERLHPDVFTHDALTVGGAVQVVDADLGLNFATRIVRLERDLALPGNTKLKLSNLPEDLVGQLGQTNRRTRSVQPEKKTEKRRPTLQMTRLLETSAGVAIGVIALSEGPRVAINYHTLTSTQSSSGVAFTRDPASGWKESGHSVDVTIPRSARAQDIKTFEAFILDENGSESIRGFELVHNIQVSSTNIGSGAITADNLVKSAQRYGFDGAFSATDWDIVVWSTGVMTFSDGVSHNIAAANTGNMGAGLYYVYWSSTNSTGFTVTQASSAFTVGDDKLLVAVAQRASAGITGGQDAFFVPGVGVLGLNQDNISANSIQTNQLAANAVTAAKIDVANLSAINANLGTVTAGQISADVIVASSRFTAAQAVFTGGIDTQSGGPATNTFRSLVRFRTGGAVAIEDSRILEFYSDTGFQGDMRAESTGMLVRGNWFFTDPTGSFNVTNMKATFGDELMMAGVNTPAQITGNVNNYPTAGYFHLRLDSDAQRNITGFADGSAGKMLWITNVGGNTIRFTNNDGASVAANRIITGHGASFDITSDETVIFMYDGVSARWRVYGHHA